MTDPADLPALLAALEVRMLDDRARGGLQAPEHYAAAFPEAAAAVAVLHARLAGSRRDRLGEATDLAVAAAAADQDLAPGRRVGGYRLERELGRGGQGVVFLAQDERLARTVALKLLPLHGPQSSAVAARFRREALVAARLEHPGICTVYDAGCSDGFAFLAMRPVSGVSLQQHLAELPAAPCPARQALLPVLERVARALQHAHEHGVVHRDVKPGNVLLADDGEPVMVDFGLAADASDDGSRLTQSTDRLGTPAYMAPEQLTGDAVDALTDVYALGALLHECLLGTRPFPAPTREALYAAIRAGFEAQPVRRPAHLSRDAWAVLTTALASDPQRRYASAAAFAEDLSALHRGAPVQARPPGTLRLLLAVGRRHPVFATALVAVILLLASIAAVVAASNRQLRFALAEARWLADARLVRSLAEGMLHVPARAPGDAAALQAWLERAEQLAARLPEHRAHLAELRAAALPYGDVERAADARDARQRLGVDALRKRLQNVDRRIADGTAGPAERTDRDLLAADLARREARAAERQTWRFADPDLAWQHEALTALVVELGTFATDDLGGLARMRTAAADLQRATALAADPAVQQLWREVAAAVADAQRSPFYRGLSLRPQFGLLPLGRDPHSGLQEFAHLRSGPPAVRGADGELVLRDDTGVVLVLLPGGPFQPSHTTSPLELRPFFLARHEWTQAQYERCRGDDTAIFAMHTLVDGKWLGPREPMENVSWLVADRMTAAMGLALPTEAQWEYGARGGTKTTWWCGNTLADLEGKANLLDASCVRVFGRTPNSAGAAPFDDGFAVHTVVDAEPSNPWGIGGTLGNVAEWCADAYQTRPVPLRAGDGLAEVPPTNQRAIRGGSFGTEVAMAEPGSRSQAGAMDHANTIGFRAARYLEE